MKQKLVLLLLALFLCFVCTHAQHEDIPYENVDNICESSCLCLTGQDTNKRYHHMLSCTSRNFKHILARWPENFGKNHNGVDIVASFSGNTIAVLQQLPATNATLTFSCKNCHIHSLQSPTFMDVPNIKRLDLSWNELTADELTGDVFRGPYRTTHYEPIGLVELDLSHNKLQTLDRKIFEHTPHLRKLNLSYNKLRSFDTQFIMALVSVPNLEVLDLSHTAINALHIKIFQSIKKLRVLNIAGNNFTKPPSDLHLIGSTLETLNLAETQIKELDELSFSGLKALKRLNISNLPLLTTIKNTTFMELTKLENLHCTHNTKLEQFDLDCLGKSKNLSNLDISHCNIASLKLTANLTTSKNETQEKLWPQLRSFEFAGNPWACDCELLTILDYLNVSASVHIGINEARCDTPYLFAGALVTSLNITKICSLQIPKKYRVVDEDPPRFLRKRYIILTLITASVVIVIGLIIGFIVSCIRRRLKHQDFGIEPIRYTSVRCSNLSAFSNQNRNSA